MKIKISDNEIIEIKNIYEEFTLADLTDLVERLNNAFPSEKITTFLGHKTTITLPYSPKINKTAGGISRETAIEMLKDYYFNHKNTKVPKEKASYLRKHLSLQPQEIGLKRIPQGRIRWEDINLYQLNPNEKIISNNYSNENKKKYKHSQTYLEKGYGKTGTSELTTKRKKEFVKRGTIPFRTNRDEAIKVTKLHYFGNKDEKKKYAQALNMDWQMDIVKGLHGIRNRFNIKSQEVGLTTFPKKYEFKKIKEIKAISEKQPEQSEKPKDELLEEVQYY